MIRRSGAALLAVIAVGMSAGCSGVERPERDLPPKNRAQWTLPLDRYTEPAVDRSQVAVQLLAQQCIQAKGYAWSVVTSSLTAGPGESWNAAGRKLFTEELAAKYGYSNSGFSAVSIEEQQKEIDADLANGEVGKTASGVTEPCLSRAQRKVGRDFSPDEGPYWLAAELGFTASAEAEETSSVQKATTRWRTCAQDIGLADLPADPNSMPSPSIRALRPWTDTATTAADNLNVTAEERRVAIADAKCQESSGWAEASYSAEWDAEVKVVHEHADELERYLVQAKKLEKRTEAVIASHAPTAG